MDIIKEIFMMERITFSLRSRGAIFFRKWEKWTAFISDEVDAAFLLVPVDIKGHLTCEIMNL